jgi:hypothetical protein
MRFCWRWRPAAREREIVSSLSGKGLSTYDSH